MGLYARPLHVRLPVGLDPLPSPPRPPLSLLFFCQNSEDKEIRLGIELSSIQKRRREKGSILTDSQSQVGLGRDCIQTCRWIFESIPQIHTRLIWVGYG